MNVGWELTGLCRVRSSIVGSGTSSSKLAEVRKTAAIPNRAGALDNDTVFEVLEA
jgi:hypothetical protein